MKVLSNRGKGEVQKRVIHLMTVALLEDLAVNRRHLRRPWSWTPAGRIGTHFPVGAAATNEYKQAVSRRWVGSEQAVSRR